MRNTQAPALLAAFLSLLLGAETRAQEVMEFEPVPPESVTAMEQRRARDARRAAEAATERATRGRGIPAIPPVPSIPEARHGDVVRIGSDIHIEKDQVVDGDVFALQGDIRVDGHVKGNVASTGGDVTLGSTARVDGDVMCIGGRLEEESGARVSGQRVTALRGGARERRMRADPEDWDDDHRGSKMSSAFSWLIVSLLLAWGIARFAAGRTTVALGTLKREPGLTLLLGLGLVLLIVPSIVAMALVVVILCITIIGIPLALGVMLAYCGLLIVLALWGYVVGVIPVGERLSARVTPGSTDLTRAALFGVLVIAGLKLVSQIFHFMPFFGWFGTLLSVIAAVAGAALTLMGAGALVRSKFGQGVNARWWPLFKKVPAPVPAPTPAEGSPTPAAGPGGTPGEPSPAA